MSWFHDHLAPVETLLFRSDLVKIGSFACDIHHRCFVATERLDNDVFVLPKNPLWIRRDFGKYHFVEPGAILLHRAGSRIERRHVLDLPERTHWFGLRPDIFIESLRYHRLSIEKMGGALIIDPRLRYRLALLLRRLVLGAADQLAIEERVLALFHEICERRACLDTPKSRSRLDTRERQRKLVDNARAYLEAHRSESIGLQAVARAVGTSTYHLCRVFRAQTGLTMHAYRTRQRLGVVMDRLVDGHAASLTELALDAGFASHSHFSRVFRKHLGVSPSAVRSAARRASHDAPLPHWRY